MSQAHPSGRFLRGLVDLMSAPARDIPRDLSAVLAPYVPHTALITLTADAAGGQRQEFGDPAFTTAVTALDLDQIRGDAANVEAVHRSSLPLDCESRTVLHAHARNGALLMLADPATTDADDLVLSTWNIVALHQQKLPDDGSPRYLQNARAAASARMEALTELADEYSTTLESILDTLRSDRLDDTAARTNAIGIAAGGLVHLRTASDKVRTFTEEPVTTAFARLQDDLRPVTRYRDIDVQFVDPPVDGRPLPGEVAHGARAVVRGTILALTDHPGVSKVRVQWDCDGTNLLMNVRDDGSGDHSESSSLLSFIRERVRALHGQLALDATPGWGTEMAIVIPLDPPNSGLVSSALADLRPREVQVIELIAVGHRNRSIAERLGISENTVKFHVSRILRKLGASSRAEAISMLFADRRA
ncbi:LuxR C-terminal-related transcriptional regulator [Microbacterium sp. MPKO10]|uniref:helix-turn-helix transcriptional regulator n=1 Tax=Microbacterium sp. MPKO10 TaxID=2989818 RepID=UPI002235E1F3|nr:LuxR C-terminal-related transcriptional regulator [Microbacterium sp. MPKO10]MCW4457385.1 LuxR C-terminal-related transcriptional regulator [Microbacterium sp. MPKO10]